MRVALGATALTCLALGAALADEPDLVPPDAFFIGRPAFARAEQPVKQPGNCDTIRAQLPDKVRPDIRIDMAISGPLTLIQTDGALWYLAVCADPGVRVLCVTYSDNGLKLGEMATLRGGYNRQDPRHILLDPCLASAAGDD